MIQDVRAQALKAAMTHHRHLSMLRAAQTVTAPISLSTLTTQTVKAVMTQHLVHLLKNVSSNFGNSQFL